MEISEEDGHESRESLSERYPAAFVQAIRETPLALSSDLNANTPTAGQSAGIGLRDLGRMQIFPFGLMGDYDVDLFPAMAGQEALRDVQKAQVKRAREETMEELSAILQRVKFTLLELKTAEKELAVSETPEPTKKQTKKRKRRRKRNKDKDETVPSSDVALTPDRIPTEISSEEKQAEQKQGETIAQFEGGEELVTKPRSGHLMTSSTEQLPTLSADPMSSESWSSSGEYETGSSYPEDEEMSSDAAEALDKPGELPYFSTPPGVQQKPPALSPTLMRKAARRRRTSDAIAGYIEHCMEREDIMLQMKSWIEAAADEEPPRSLSQMEERYSPGLLREELPLAIGGAVETFKETLTKLKRIADSLGIGDAEDEKEEEKETSVNSTKPGLPPPPKPKATVKIFDDSELSIPNNFNVACSLLVKIMDEAAKSTPARRTRISLNNGLQQFQFIRKVMTSRANKINQLDKEVIDMGGEITKIKKQNDELRKTKKKMQVQYEKLEHQLDDLKVQLKRKDVVIADLNKVVEDYKRKESYGLFRESSSEDSSPSTASTPESFEEKPKHARNKEKKKEVKKRKGKEKSTTSGTSKKSEAEIQEKKEIKVEEAKPVDKSDKPQESVKDIERSEVYQKLATDYENTEKALLIEQEKLSEMEKELENSKDEKVKIEQEKADLDIAIENLKRNQEIELEELKDNIKDLERENKKLKGEIECNDEMIQYQEERINQYAEEIEKLEDKLMYLPTTPAVSPTSKDRRRSTVGLAEPPTARQMIAKIKQQYESEIQGLKDHLAKESQRHQADVRRRDQEHKKDITNIHKESLLLLRAINRFKECAASLLDRENILAEAHALRKLPPLPLDDTPGETRQMLARMAILSNELLVSIELQLSKALMSKRLEIKDTSISRELVKKELDNQMESLRKVKDITSMQAGKLKAAREGIIEQEQEFMRFRLREGEKKEQLEERYKQLLNEYIALRKEVIEAKKAEKPDREKDEELNRKEALIHKYMRREKGMQRMLEEQKKVISNLASAWRTRRVGQLFISKEDQLDNLKTISEIMTKNKISKTLHEMTTTLIKDAIDLPRRRFIDLVQRYVHHVHLQELEKRAKQMKTEKDLGSGATKFLYMLERRIQQKKQVWKKRQEEFVGRRADILIELSKVLTRVSEEAGILLSKPKYLTRRTADMSVDVQDTGIEERLRALRDAQMTSRIPIAERDKSPPAGTISGYGEVNRVPVWKMKALAARSHVYVTTPKILDIDVNQTRLAAQEIVKRISRGQLDSASMPKIKTLTSRVYPAVKKSVSDPFPRRSPPARRTLALPPIATMYPSEDYNAETNGS
ncbi:trichohyalin-like [Nematostella vectensis]|uniref:trichohyalin-like n=1 Tax=Nematostella vectensis TaxID=45351 RepID=UPI00207796FA|nr:trichohyalin-like [Nematostella vectensis]